jgi:hypothetical protein
LPEQNNIPISKTNNKPGVEISTLPYINSLSRCQDMWVEMEHQSQFYRVSGRELGWDSLLPEQKADIQKPPVGLDKKL